MLNESDWLEIPDYARIRDQFCDELTLAADGKASSIPFIRNQLPKQSLVAPNEVFEVFVIGGTSGEHATVKYLSNGDIELIAYEAHPELAKFHTDADFFKFIAAHTNPATRVIGLNFAFTLTPTVGRESQLDGVMISGDTKGHAFTGLQGEQVGARLEDYLRQSRKQQAIVSVGNDTVCLIAAAATPDNPRDQLAAGIVGTGYNLACFLGDNTVINLQASDFTGFIPTATGRIVDQHSSNPGEQLYNKEVAGGELYKHFNALIADSGLVAEPLRSTVGLAELATSDNSEVSAIARDLLKRSAWLVAAQLAGLYEFKNKPQCLTMVMQGSLFWKGPQYKNTVIEALKELGLPDNAIDFVRIEHSDIIGAAKLVTGGL